MILTASFTARDLSTAVKLPATVTYTVKRITKAAKGGPKQADIELTGPAEDLYDVLNWLRYGVMVKTTFGKPAWWGYVHEVGLQDDGVQWTASLERMSNRVAVAYTLVAYGQSNTGARRTTTWIEDIASIAEYGKKEKLVGLGGVTDAHAGYKRDKYLTDHSAPVAVPRRSRSGKDEKATANLTCFGWWQTLDWLYAAVPTSLAFAYDSLGNLGVHVGDGDREILAETFTVGPVAWNLQEIEIYCRKVGAPVDNLQVQICANPPENPPGTPNPDYNVKPGAQVASQSIEGALVSGTTAWHRFTLSSPVALTANTGYWVTVSRSGGTDAANYYAVRLNEAQTFPGGILRQSISNAWSDVAADMPFRLYTNNLVENAEQMRSMLSAFGQFFSQVTVDNTSGISTESYRNGDYSVASEIDELIGVGTTNLRRLLATVGPQREVVVSEEPAAESSAPYYLEKDGRFYDAFGAPIDAEECPVGFWAKARSTLSPAVSRSSLGGMSLFFVEETSYDATSGELDFTPFEDEEYLRVGEMTNG